MGAEGDKTPPCPCKKRKEKDGAPGELTTETRRHGEKRVILYKNLKTQRAQRKAAEGAENILNHRG
jgi:hypothetical protein